MDNHPLGELKEVRMCIKPDKANILIDTDIRQPTVAHTYGDEWYMYSVYRMRLSTDRNVVVQYHWAKGERSKERTLLHDWHFHSMVSEFNP